MSFMFKFFQSTSQSLTIHSCDLVFLKTQKPPVKIAKKNDLLLTKSFKYSSLSSSTLYSQCQNRLMF
ncbi:hypothetical protein AQUCO_04700090v1 [Aquilegia coerulea]|uniref:Uncharacterized protein n=1 Tax=Aquilegia coerulea TaxID=218851 RepID=A0A2G5CL46_AQUCA|nr:hypothetical protein AQUCO_04700090v1 [Aquilegia coerulea]